MTEQRYARQLGIFNPNDFKHHKITIIGCGSVGSFTALTLCKMGMEKVILMDDDLIEEHNIPNQFFPLGHNGNRKAQTLAQNVLRIFSGAKPCVLNMKFKPNMPLHTPIVISAVDSMTARKEIFERCKKDKVRLFIDARMGGQSLVVFTVNMFKKKDVARYEKTLHGDVRTACTDKAIIYNVLFISAIIARQFVKVCMKEKYAFEVNGDTANLELMKDF